MSVAIEAGMAMMITDECIGCGVCEAECPNEAISLGPTIFVVDPSRCAECVGRYDAPHCADICPPMACVPDPTHVESREALHAKLERIQGWV